ncbi:GntR family transcriptional regulator [Mesorhizobium sp. M0802]|uniref:GntR family transcriptional regulator n=1 Tax=Mesorhizobium sp. M0802 TaxID=2957001 RepID=UPI00333A82EE
MTESPKAKPDRIMQPIEPALMHDRVYASLSAAVMAGRFIPGQSVIIREVAAQFETSPMPVREAVRRLVALRAFISLPNRAVQVPEFSPETVRDLCRVRLGIEGLATLWAAENATPKLVKLLRKLLRREIECAGKSDFSGMLDANRAFHFTIYQAAGSEKLLPCIEMLWLQIGPYFGVLNGHPSLGRYHDEHERIIERLEEQDGPGAQAAISRHITMAAEDILAAWPKPAASRHDGVEHVVSSNLI